MTRTLARGQKLRLDSLTPASEVVIGLGLSGPGLSFDVSCFGLDAGRRLADDRYLVFYNQPASPEGAVRQTGPDGVDDQTFTVRLDLVPPAIDRLVFVASIDGHGSMGQVR